MRCFKLIIYLFLFTGANRVFAQGASFTVNGTVDPGLNIETVYFSQATFINNTFQKSIRIPVVGGKFIITGTLTEPGPGLISLVEDLKPKNPADIKQFILDKGIISFTVKDKLSSAVIGGSKANDDIVKYTSGQVSYVQKINALNEIADQQSRQGVPMDSIVSTYGPLLKDASTELYGYQRSFVTQHPSAFISLLLLPEIARFNSNFLEADSILEGLDLVVKSSPTGTAIKNYIGAEKKTSVGAFAPEFAASDTAGKKLALSSLKGKYVLLDFWAAWCGPCRQENPNVVKAYQTYKDRGFTVLGVSLDRDRKDWLKGIRADNLTWPHVSDLKHFASPTAILYNISSIPRNFLLDPTGKIIARDLRGVDLQEKLEEIFGEQGIRKE
ncbi:MAG: redoxin domain-containing protein [Daejeonella sp.]